MSVEGPFAVAVRVLGPEGEVLRRVVAVESFTLVGSAPFADLCVPVAGVAPLHLVLLRHEGRLLVKARDGRLTVDGQLTDAHPVPGSARIGFGEAVLELHDLASADEPAVASGPADPLGLGTGAPLDEPTLAVPPRPEPPPVFAPPVLDLSTHRPAPRAVGGIPAPLDLPAVVSVAAPRRGPTVRPPAVPVPAAPQPVVVQPAIAQPVVARPATGQPATAQPVVARPVTGQPATAQPVVARPVTAQPALAQPVAAQPAAARPSAAPQVLRPPQPDLGLGDGGELPADPAERTVATGPTGATGNAELVADVSGLFSELVHQLSGSEHPGEGAPEPTIQAAAVSARQSWAVDDPWRPGAEPSNAARPAPPSSGESGGSSPWRPVISSAGVAVRGRAAGESAAHDVWAPVTPRPSARGDLPASINTIPPGGARAVGWARAGAVGGADDGGFERADDDGFEDADDTGFPDDGGSAGADDGGLTGADDGGFPGADDGGLTGADDGDTGPTATGTTRARTDGPGLDAFSSDFEGLDAGAASAEAPSGLRLRFGRGQVEGMPDRLAVCLLLAFAVHIGVPFLKPPPPEAQAFEQLPERWVAPVRLAPEVRIERAVAADRREREIEADLKRVQPPPPKPRTREVPRQAPPSAAPSAPAPEVAKNGEPDRPTPPAPRLRADTRDKLLAMGPAGLGAPAGGGKGLGVGAGKLGLGPGGTPGGLGGPGLGGPGGVLGAPGGLGGPGGGPGKGAGWGRAFGPGVAPVSSAGKRGGSPAQYQQTLRQTIQRRFYSDVKACYDRALRTDDRLRGRLIAQFTVRGDGALGPIDFRFEPDPEGAGDPQRFLTCVRAMPLGAKFPAPPDGGEVRISYPFRLKPVE